MSKPLALLYVSVLAEKEKKKKAFVSTCIDLKRDSNRNLLKWPNDGNACSAK